MPPSKDHLFKVLATLLACTFLLCDPGLAQESQLESIESYRSQADALVKQANAAEIGWERLRILCTYFPHRLSGSAQLEGAIDWVVEEMKKDGFDRVTTEAVLVPHWERVNEELFLLRESKQKLSVIALGGSVSTPPEGIRAQALVVKSYEDLERKKAEASGKIVVFNVPFTRYGETVRYRAYGASRAAEAGAVACLVRSVTPHSLGAPHTGAMRYEDNIPQIPAGAITPEGADYLYRLQEYGEKVQLELKIETRDHETDKPSRNILAEIKGREFPEQVVLMGGHIDGWDVGEGAQDDAGGSLMCWEALRIIARSGWRPRRTIRVVLWTNEENGLRGARAYRRVHDLEVKNHVLAIESDYGTFKPSGLAFSGKAEAVQILQEVLDLMKESVGAMTVRTPGGGADIGPLMKAGVPGAGLAHNDERYFWYHHSEADTLDKIDTQDFRDCVSTLAVTTFVVADIPWRLPFGKAKD